MAKLEINEFPLNQVSLIEASAGTGKTYTLSKLYMRLILGHRLETPASIKDILVVTFTNAATEELRGRIRTQLRDSLDALMRIQNTEPERRDEQFSDDEMWVWLSQMVLSESELEVLKARLILNLNLMDEASIYTIHGFCQRLLVRFALDTRLDFSANLSFNLQQPMLVAIEDVWRRLIYPLSGWQHAMISEELGSPEKLKNTLQDLFNRCDVQFYPSHKNADLTAYLQDLEQAFKRAQTTFLGLGITGLTALIDQYIKEYGLDTRSFKSNLIVSWTSACEAYFNQDSPCSAVGKKPLEHLISNKIVDKSNLSFGQVHEFFNQMQALSDLANALPEYLYPFVYEQVQQTFKQQLKQENLISSNDLLKALYDSLWAEKTAGKQGLAKAIRKLYPYALIDEFQDTDAIQYGIFNLVYLQNAQDNQAQRGALMMIGDPKQAIYRFRGADIHTYIQAKKALPDARCFNLDSNWRSHPSIISALNHLWQKPNVFLADNAIEYVPVNAGLPEHKNVLQLDGKPLSGVHIWHQNKKDDGLLEAARACATNIKALLSKPASLDGKPLESGDIAILVRSKAQAAIIHQALKHEQINSVLASSEFLFASEQAKGLLSWLKAVNQPPSNERLIRQAMIDELQLESADSLESYLNDEQKFESQLKAYARWQQIWAQSGVIAAMMDWLRQDERAVKLSLKDNGERCLTNLLHLGELLEQQARKLSGQKRLINWLQERIEDGDENNDEYSLRLETDANLVQISTIHSSKGLQYPIVFLPFLWADKTNIRGIKEYQHECQGHVFDFSDNKQAKKAYQKEIEAENMRLLYVAMTRAESACFIQLINEPNTKKEPFPKAANSALGSLLKLKDINSEVLDEHFVEAQKIAPNGLCYASTPNWVSHNTISDHKVEELTAPKALRRLDLSHKLASYSYLIKDQTDEFYDGMSAERDWQSHEYLQTTHAQDQNTAEPAQGNQIDVMANQFVKGANAGTCLHSIFELWDFKDQQALETICEQQLMRYGIELPKEQQPALHHWLTQVVQCPIYANDTVFSLAQIEQSQRLDELEFYLPIKDLSAAQINPLVDSKLGFHTFKGHLKGFIDLIFCYQDRYYVADYKSNHLGEYQENYAPDELNHAMISHHYDLQAQLYLTALDRILAQRLPDYDAQTHLGGVLYLFVRGMSEHSQTKPEAQSDGVHYQSVDMPKLVQLRALFDCSHEEAKTV